MNRTRARKTVCSPGRARAEVRRSQRAAVTASFQMQQHMRATVEMNLQQAGMPGPMARMIVRLIYDQFQEKATQAAILTQLLESGALSEVPYWQAEAAHIERAVGEAVGKTDRVILATGRIPAPGNR